MYITTQNIFPIPDDAVARNSIIIFIFNSRRPHLNYIFLSNVYSFATMEFLRNVSANLFIFTNKASSPVVIVNKSESLKCAKVVVLNLGAILFFCGIHFKPLKIMKKVSQRSEYAHSTKDKRVRLVSTCRKVALVDSLLPGWNFRKGKF